METTKKQPEFRPGFIGHEALTVDTRGRVVVSPSFRKVLEAEFPQDEGRVYLSLLPEKCVAVFPRSVFLSQLAQLKQQLPEAKRRADAAPAENWEMQQHYVQELSQFIDFLSAYAHEDSLDSQNRIRLTSTLCYFSHILKEVFLIGRGHYFEIWDRRSWERYAEAYGEKCTKFTHLLKIDLT